MRLLVTVVRNCAFVLSDEEAAASPKTGVSLEILPKCRVMQVHVGRGGGAQWSSDGRVAARHNLPLIVYASAPTDALVLRGSSPRSDLGPRTCAAHREMTPPDSFQRRGETAPSPILGRSAVRSLFVS